MGTNYYALPIKSKRDWENTRQLRIKEASHSDALVNIVNEYFDGIRPEPIHVGKSSGGWKFCFNYNEGKFYTDIDTMKRFLSECIITSEYGEVISFSDFWGKVVENRMWNGRPAKSQAGQYNAFEIYGYDFLDCEFS